MDYNFYTNITEGKENKGPVIGDPYFLQTKEEIEKWLKKYEIDNYIINDDLTVDVNGIVNLHSSKLSKIPIKFGKISGNFSVSSNKLTSLKGCPKEVLGDFYCSSNKLKSLEYCPEIVKGFFSCVENELTSLKYCPEKIEDSFNCRNNKLEDLEFMPKSISGKFYFDKNPLKNISHLSKFNDSIIFDLIIEYPHLSWMGIKKELLQKLEKPEQFIDLISKAVDGYVNILKNGNIPDIDKYIEFLYENSNTTNHKEYSIFCQTILRDMEELQLY